MGNPDPALINTSFAERQNLTMRMSMRRFTRLTNAFSKKFENHCHALALYFVFYNFCRVHKTLGATPAMAAGLVDKVLKMTDVVALIDAEAAKMPQFEGRTNRDCPRNGNTCSTAPICITITKNRQINDYQIGNHFRTLYVLNTNHRKRPKMNDHNLSRLVELAKGVHMNDEQRSEQRNSFVYGNTKIENTNVTRELVDEIARSLPKGSVHHA